LEKCLEIFSKDNTLLVKMLRCIISQHIYDKKKAIVESKPYEMLTRKSMLHQRSEIMELSNQFISELIGKISG